VVHVSTSALEMALVLKKGTKGKVSLLFKKVMEHYGNFQDISVLLFQEL
jgi:hypothetical protein